MDQLKKYVVIFFCHVIIRILSCTPFIINYFICSLYRVYHMMNLQLYFVDIWI